MANNTVDSLLYKNDDRRTLDISDDSYFLGVGVDSTFLNLENSSQQMVIGTSLMVTMLRVIPEEFMLKFKL